MTAESLPGLGKIPVTVLTGFLGSGKTTVLNFFLGQVMKSSRGQALLGDSSRMPEKVAALTKAEDLLAQIGLNGLGGSDTGAGVIPNPTPGGPPTVIGTANEQVLGGYSRSLALLTDGRYYEYLVGASLSIPIANAAAKAEYAQAKVNAEGARLSLQQEEEEVSREITQAVNNLKSLTTNIEARRIARELAEENVRNQQARYDVGLATTKDLIDFQDRLTQAQRAEIDTLTLYNTQLAELRRADGTLLDAHNIVLERADPEPPPWWARF
jgi:energy-coupling factor transporter ATP-binding protein EcfA2